MTLYCMKGDGKEAYSMLEGTLYCEEHVHKIIEAQHYPVTLPPPNQGEQSTKGG